MERSTLSSAVYATVLLGWRATPGGSELLRLISRARWLHRPVCYLDFIDIAVL